MSVQADIQKAVWGGTIPLVISLSSDDLTDFVIPRPLHLTVPRLILWSSVVTIVHSYFLKQTAQLDTTFYPYDNKFLLSTNPVLEACANELDLAEIKSPVWLEGPGKTVIDWRVPVGVCVDLWTSTGSINSEYLDHSASFPIKIVAHFTKRPENLPDCHVVVCRGWSQQHKQAAKDEEGHHHKDSSSGLGHPSNTNSTSKKDADSIAKHTINSTKRALIEHNTRALLPIFLQLPSSTHNRACLSRLRMSSSILHKVPTYVMGLPTVSQSQFVSCMFSNSCAELSTVVPMCDCSHCTTFLTTLAGYEHPGHTSVPKKAAKAVKQRVQKVISVLKRDSSDSSDDDNDDDSHDGGPGKNDNAITNMVSAGSDHSNVINPTNTNKHGGMLHRSDMTREQREQHSILTTPASILLCQITRLIILSRSLCGTLSSFEKALQRLDVDVKDAWRRRAGRFEAERGPTVSSRENTLSTSEFFSDDQSTPRAASSGSGDLSNLTEPSTPKASNLLGNTTYPAGWQPYYHNLPIKLYFTQHVTMLCSAKTDLASPKPITSSGGINSLQLKWSKYRLVSSIEQSHSAVHQTSVTSPDSSAATPAPTPTAGTLLTINNPMNGPLSPYCNDYTIEQFLLKLCPDWKYQFGKSKSLLQKEGQGNNSELAEEPSGGDKDNNPESETLSPKSLHENTSNNSNNNNGGLADNSTTLVAVCHGVILPYDTPLIWLYNHMLHADLTLHLTLALQDDIHEKFN